MMQLIFYCCKQINTCTGIIIIILNAPKTAPLLKLNCPPLTPIRDLPANPRKAHSHGEGRYLLSLVLPERGQFQRGAGGASSDEEGIWERGRGPAGPNFSQTQLWAATSWLTSSKPKETLEKVGTFLSHYCQRVKHDSHFNSIWMWLGLNVSNDKGQFFFYCLHRSWAVL